jgi:hypothetical protein
MALQSFSKSASSSKGERDYSVRQFFWTPTHSRICGGRQFAIAL